MPPIQKVMIVDDDTSVLQLEKMALEQIGGFEVLGCESGEASLEKVVAFNPDVILLDSNMPTISGPETLKGLRKLPQCTDIPVIFITGDSREAEIDKLKELGAIEVIVKPFDPMSLSQQVTDAVSRSL